MWICFSCCKLLGSKWLIPLLFLARMLSEFGTCKVGGRQELFPTLLQKLQSPDVLMTQRVYLVLNQILKELSTKRLAADQRNFTEVHILGFICNLASIEHRALSGEGQEEINGIVLVCILLAGRFLMCLSCSWYCMCRSHCSILITPGITGVLTHKASFKDFQVSSEAQKVIISLLTKSRLSV